MATDGDLGAALTMAMEAAREAGALLLAEFLRPGGPRGTLAGHGARWPATPTPTSGPRR